MYNSYNLMASLYRELPIELISLIQIVRIAGVAVSACTTAHHRLIILADLVDMLI